MYSHSNRRTHIRGKRFSRRVELRQIPVELHWVHLWPATGLKQTGRELTKKEKKKKREKRKKEKKRKEEETNFSVSAMTPTVPPYAYRRSAFPRKLIAYVQ